MLINHSLGERIFQTMRAAYRRGKVGGIIAR